MAPLMLFLVFRAGLFLEIDLLLDGAFGGGRLLGAAGKAVFLGAGSDRHLAVPS
jgi:hypothetical protein